MRGDDARAPTSEDVAARRRPQLLVAMALVAVAFVVGERISAPDSFARHLWADSCWTLASGVAAWFCVRTARVRQGHVRVAWFAFAAGCALWCAGLLLWSYHELVLATVTPFPTLAELGFLGLVPCFAFGVSRLSASAPGQAVDAKRLGDLGLVGATLVIVCTAVFREASRELEADWLYLGVALAYPVLHLGLAIFALLSLWQHRWGARRRILLVLLAGFVVLAGTTTVYGSSLLLHEYEAGDRLDVFWIAFFSIVIWASLEERWQDAPGASRWARVPELDALVPAFSILVIALVAMTHHEHIDAALVPVWGGAGVAIALALGLRVWGTHRLEVQLRDEIRREEGRRVAVANAAPVGIARVGIDGEITDTNTRFDTFIGERVRQLSDETWTATGLRDLVEEARRESPRTVDARAAFLLGTTWLRAQATAPGGADRGVLLALLDVTHEQQMEEEALRGQKMQAVGALAAGIAHDFNNLLAGAIASTTLLRRRGPSESETSALVEHLEHSLWRAADLTQRLLTLTRKRGSVVGTHDAVALTKRVVNLLSRSVDETITIRETLPERPVLFQGDAADFEHALVNLALNARDAMIAQGGGDIRVSLQTEETDGLREFVVRVSDGGPGVPEHLRPKIFDPFFTTKDPSEGTGLGLAMVQRFATEAHGSVGLVSNPGARGATFELRLPEADGTLAVTSTEVEELVSGSGTILVVDDRDGALFAMKAILSECGYDVVVAGNGIEALTELQRRQGGVDLVVTDAVMRRMSGRELLRTMRARGYRMPVILMTGHDVERQAGSGGFAATIRKPFDPAAASRIVKLVISGELDAARELSQAEAARASADAAAH